MGRGWVIALVAAFVLMGERFEVPDAWAHTPLNIFMSIGLFGALILLCCLYKLRHELARSPQAAADALAPLPGGLLAAARAA
jgi:type VI protein secretion system component VasK